MESYFAYTSLMGITISLASIVVTWWALQAFKFDLFTQNPKGARAKALQVILSIVIGYQLAQFLINYLGWSYNLKNLF
ncbi:hypothetical protein BHF71_01165 [Vulcanibacillus modesticaldus]|uniref:DUF1146 domain-containing protein n=1 Tax=Vulcanibacillus modesticaldus TaxID=337097 RepID=A0A1D2YW14_9BACI|nr:DUF1146 family protein [Vulcanibacillus modesticaldus]OEF99815.1 hypothetical protein BHF71_01165 [Vulcanibacillus modesticaldus]